MKSTSCKTNFELLVTWKFPSYNIGVEKSGWLDESSPSSNIKRAPWRDREKQWPGVQCASRAQAQCWFLWMAAMAWQASGTGTPSGSVRGTQCEGFGNQQVTLMPLTHTCSHPQLFHTSPCLPSGAPTLGSRVHLPSERMGHCESHSVRAFCRDTWPPDEAKSVRPRRAGSEGTEEPMESNQLVSVLSQARGPGACVQTPSCPLLLLVQPFSLA